MKIAVYLVGQWRGTSYDCSKYLKQLFEDFDTDYYIYTWDSYDGKDIWELTQNKTGCLMIQILILIRMMKLKK